jgi:hypothetical protein
MKQPLTLDAFMREGIEHFAQRAPEKRSDRYRAMVRERWSGRRDKVRSNTSRISASKKFNEAAPQDDKEF